MKNIFLLFFFLGAGWSISAQTDLLPGGAKGRDAGSDSTFLNVNGSAVGKRPGDNVYKNGTVGIRTTDTTGVFNISAKNPSGFYKPMGFYKGRSNGLDSVNLFQMFNSSDTVAAPFIMGVVNSGDISASGKNSSFYFGQNIYPGGAKIKQGKPALFQFWETNFINSMPILGNIQTYEWHLGYVPSNSAGADQRRILTSAFDWQGRIGNFGIKSDQVTFYKFGSLFTSKPSVYANLDFYRNAFEFNDTMDIVLRKPNAGGVWAAKSDNSIVKLISIDGSNRVSIAPNNATTIFTGVNTIQSAGGLKITTSSTANLVLGDNVLTGAVTMNAASSEVLRIQNPLSTSGFAFSMNGFEMAIRDMSVNRDIFQIEENGITDAEYIHADGRICFGGRADFDAQLHLKKTTLGAGTKMFRIENSTGGTNLFRSNAPPEGAITANQGDIALTNISSTGGIYGKYSGTGNTGWGKILNLIDPNTASTNQVLTWNGTTWAPATNTSESTKIGTFSTATDPKGLTISGDSIKLMSASLTRPGGINLIAQAFQAGAGAKLFQSTGTASIAVDNAADTGEAGISFTQLSGADIMAQMSVNSTDASNARLQLLIEDDGAYVNYLNIGTENDEKGVFESGGMYEDAPKNVTSTTYTLQYGDRNLLLNATDMVFTLQEIGTGAGQTKPGRVVWLFNDNTTSVTVTAAAGQNVIDANTLSLSGNTAIALIAAPTGKWLKKG